MKKRIINTLIAAMLLGVLYLNIYLSMAYDMNIVEYFAMPSELTKEEHEWLKSHGKIKYISDQTSPPHRYIDETEGQFQGLIVDYISALSIEVGQVITIESTAWWSQSLDKLAAGESNFLDLIPSEERSRVFDFSDPMYTLRETILFSKSKVSISNYTDLENKTVGVAKGDYAIEFLNSKVKSINYVLTEDSQTAIKLLEQGKVDAVVGEEAVIKHLYKNMDTREDYEILHKPFIEEEAVLAVKKGEKELLSILNKGIYNMKKKKTIEKINEKWFGPSVNYDKEEASQMIAFVALVFASLICLIVYISWSWSNVLKREVDKRTQELYESNKTLQTTFDGLTHLMAVVDRQHKIINVNKAFCSILNLDKNDIIGQRSLDFQHVLHGPGVEDMIESTFEGGEQAQKEFRHESQMFQMSTFPLEDKRKNVAAVLVMIKDITDFMIREQQILHESKMAATGQLAAGVAHEIRNPLGLIRNYCYIIKNNMNDEHKLKRAVDVIESSVQRSSNIIDNLLNFSRISANEYEKVNIKALINNIVALENNIIEKRKIHIDVSCPEDISFFANEESMKHIFINLISNAIDAMHQGGIIKIACGKSEDGISIVLCDNGKGISKEDLGNIFNPFFTTKPVGKGTGLGLYIVYNEIQKHGGKIWVSSEPGKGTCFQMQLPFRGE